MRYFPLSGDHFEHQFGVRAIEGSDCALEATEHYAEEIKLLRHLLVQNEETYFQALHGSTAAQMEAAEWIIDEASFLNHGVNQLLAEPIHLDDRPLLAIGRHVQEDLVLLAPNSEAGFPLIAGKVCFPNGWDIRSKCGLPFMELHVPVPEFAEAMGDPSMQLLAKLKTGRPVWRTNWALRPTKELDQSPAHADRIRTLTADLSAKSAGENCYLRVERQTLSRLPKTSAILFTIHTHQSRLLSLSDLQRSYLLGTLRSCPQDTLRYKGILPMYDAVTEYLSANAPSN